VAACFGRNVSVLKNKIHGNAVQIAASVVRDYVHREKVGTMNRETRRPSLNGFQGMFQKSYVLGCCLSTSFMIHYTCFAFCSTHSRWHISPYVYSSVCGVPKVRIRMCAQEITFCLPPQQRTRHPTALGHMGRAQISRRIINASSSCDKAKTNAQYISYLDIQNVVCII
jgi:hypothetical protein